MLKNIIRGVVADLSSLPFIDSPMAKQQVTAVIKHLGGVSREEFDAQTAVLLRTRERLEALEDALEALEQQSGHR
ncbi:MAG: accessory factor UbiK family protein [Cellvibrionaceae bacterium]|nr:accessory factor UbiK family protein [Cellvibrionaceae bacterium]